MHLSLAFMANQKNLPRSRTHTFLWGSGPKDHRCVGTSRRRQIKWVPERSDCLLADFITRKSEGQETAFGQEPPNLCASAQRHLYIGLWPGSRSQEFFYWKWLWDGGVCQISFFFFFEEISWTNAGLWPIHEPFQKNSEREPIGRRPPQIVHGKKKEEKENVAQRPLFSFSFFFLDALFVVSFSFVFF